MNNSKTILQDELLTFADSRHYIETLYLQTNLHSHIKGELSNDKKHLIALNQFYDDKLVYGEYIGNSSNRNWYRFDNYRVGVITDYDKAIKSNWYTVLIQYEQSHMWTLKGDLKGLDLPLTTDRSLYKIQRADTTLIYKSDIDYLNGYGIISKYRKQHTIDKNGVIETKYLGTRSGGNMVRWYNKTNELKQTENYKKIELLSKYFGDIENLYTIELEMSRDYLVRTMNIDTLEDIEKLKEAYKNIIGGMRVYELSIKNEELLKGRHSDRITAKRFSEWVEYERVEKKRYKPSKEYLTDRMASSTKKYLESMGIEKEDCNKVALSIANNYITKMGMGGADDLVISYEPSMLSDEIEEMKEKHERLRDCGNDLLIFEAQKAFKPLPFVSNKVV